MTSPAEVCTLNFLSTILSYRPDLAPSEDELKHTAVESRQRLTQRRERCVDNGDCVEKSPESIRQMFPRYVCIFLYN